MLFKFSTFLLIILCIFSCVQKASQEIKPNVLFILADDLGYGDLRCYNPNSKIPTPNLDKLAGQGIRFTNVHTPSSVCTPTRYGLLTGRYAWRTRLKEKVLWPYAQPLIHENRKTLADLFREQGYQTAMFGKWHLGWGWPVVDSTTYPWDKRMDGNWSGKGIDLSKPIKSGPMGAGFDYSFGVDYPNAPPYAFIENGRLVGGVPQGTKTDEMFGSNGVAEIGWKQEQVLPAIVNRTKAYLDTVSNPFFIYLPLTSPHTPIRPNEEFVNVSEAGDYGDFIVETDIYIGEIMDILDEKGILENTLVILTSDNGSPAKAGDPAKRPTEWSEFGAVERMFDHYPNAPYRGYKAGLYEGGSRVPFIAYWPGKIEGGEVSDQLFGLQDMMATFHNFFDSKLEDNEGEDSFDVSTYLFENEYDTVVRDHLITHSERGSFAITKDGWKFIADSSSGGTSFKYRELLGTYVSNNPGQLYHLDIDPYEQNDQFENNAEKVAELRKLLINYVERGRSTKGPVMINDFYNETWNQLEFMKSGWN